jgi:hypothetical protein
MRRVLLGLVALLAVPAALLIALPAASAFAASPTIVSCSTFTGSSTAAGSTGAATGCNHRAISGGKATQTSSGSTFLVTWKTGKTTTGTDTTTVVTPSTCPSTFPEEVEAFGTVTGGTAKRLIGGEATSLFCANTTTGAFELLPGTTWNM